MAVDLCGSQQGKTGAQLIILVTFQSLLWREITIALIDTIVQSRSLLQTKEILSQVCQNKLINSVFKHEIYSPFRSIGS